MTLTSFYVTVPFDRSWRFVWGLRRFRKILVVLKNLLPSLRVFVELLLLVFYQYSVAGVLLYGCAIPQAICGDKSILSDSALTGVVHDINKTEYGLTSSSTGCVTPPTLPLTMYIDDFFGSSSEGGGNASYLVLSQANMICGRQNFPTFQQELNTTVWGKWTWLDGWQQTAYHENLWYGFNFDSMSQAIVTLFAQLIVNNWYVESFELLTRCISVSNKCLLGL